MADNDILAMAIQDAGIDKEPFMETTEPSNVDPPAQSFPVPRQDILAIKENETSVESVPKPRGEETQIAVKSNGVSNSEISNSVTNKAIIIIRKSTDPSKNQCKFCHNIYSNLHNKKLHERGCIEFQKTYSVEFKVLKPISTDDEDVGNGYYCPICHRKFKMAKTRSHHQKKANCRSKKAIYGRGIFKCTLCKGGYQTKWYLKQHMKRKHAQSSLEV